MGVLLGRTTAGTTADFSASGATDVWKFTAVATGLVTTIWAQTKLANPTGIVRLGIYDDDAANARAGNLLGVSTATNATGTTPFSATLPTPVLVVSGTVYWLGWRNSAENFDFQGDAGGSYLEKTGVDFPNPYGLATTTTGAINAILWAEDAGSYIASRAMDGTGKRPVPMIQGPDTDQVMRMYRRG